MRRYISELKVYQSGLFFFFRNGFRSLGLTKSTTPPNGGSPSLGLLSPVLMCRPRGSTQGRKCSYCPHRLVRASGLFSITSTQVRNTVS